jgi:hypothetical protein
MFWIVFYNQQPYLMFLSLMSLFISFMVIACRFTITQILNKLSYKFPTCYLIELLILWARSVLFVLQRLTLTKGYKIRQLLWKQINNGAYCFIQCELFTKCQIDKADNKGTLHKPKMCTTYKPCLLTLALRPIQLRCFSLPFFLVVVVRYLTCFEIARST